MLTQAELEAASMLFDGMMKRLEESVMQDIIRRIRINSEITRSADWQIHRLYELGESRRELSRLIKDGLQIDDEKLTDMFRGIICSGYARDDKLYKMTAKTRIPFDENTGLQQYISAVAQQTGSTMKKLSQSMGFSVNVGGRVQFQPIAAYYQDTLDNAVNGIATGAFDYNTVLKRTVKEMTDSGLRTVDYASGHVDRVDVAARRAVMTGLTQITAKVNDDNAKALETDTFEISWHSGARPSHQVWQGRWYTEKELTTVCGLGSVTGLCGANCYHSYYPVIPGVSVPNYTAEELDEMNRRENEPVEYNGKEYTKYEATQRQRYLERKMRAQRQEIKLLQDGGADENDLIAARCRYRQTSQTYTDFSKAMELPQQRQRVTIDGLGNIGVGKWKEPAQKMAVQFPKGFKDTRQIGSQISSDDLQKVIERVEASGMAFGSVKGSRCGGFDSYCGDIGVLEELLTHLENNQPLLTELSGSGKIVLRYDYVKTDSGEVDVGTFAITNGRTITFNKFMYDDSDYLSAEYADAVETGLFAKGTTYLNVPDHECGHVFARYDKRYLIKTRNACKKLADELNISESDFIVFNISEYANHKDELPAEINAMKYGKNRDLSLIILQEAGLL